MTLAKTRLVLVAFGVLLVTAGVAFGFAHGDEVYVPWLWGPWFVLAGLSCWLFAWRLESAFWWQASRVLTVMVILARLYGVIGLVNEHRANSWRALATGCLYVLGAGALHRVWTIDFRYWSRLKATAAGRR